MSMSYLNYKSVGGIMSQKKVFVRLPDVMDCIEDNIKYIQGIENAKITERNQYDRKFIDTCKYLYEIFGGRYYVSKFIQEFLKDWNIERYNKTTQAQLVYLIGINDQFREYVKITKNKRVFKQLKTRLSGCKDIAEMENAIKDFKVKAGRETLNDLILLGD